MRYKTLHAVIVKGDRIERGSIIEIDAVLAESIGAEYLQPFDGETASPAPKEPEKPIEEMSYIELKKKAKELGLSDRGNKADLLERIRLQAK